MRITFLGTSAARPTVERNVSSIAIQREGETLMFDCGEGTQRQMMRFGVPFSLAEIFVTHFHADHYLGMTGLLRTLSLQGRTEPMMLYGPRGAGRVLRAAVGVGFERHLFEVGITELKAGEKLERDAYDLIPFRVIHGRSALGYCLAEHDRLGRFNPQKARELGVPEGPLWGRLHRGETVELADGRRVAPEDLVGAPRPGRRVVYTGDTAPSQSVVDVAEGADLLIHDATFTHEEADRARETEHSTAVQAAQVALAARVRKLVLTHLSARYSAAPGPLLDEAREIFPETCVAYDGMVMELPVRDE